MVGSYKKTEDDKKVKAVQGGRLFKAFREANRRLKLGKELNDRAEKAYNEYLADPENPAKLQALEDIELEIAMSQDYTTAGGDVKILKELDHHNEHAHTRSNDDLDDEAGLFLYDMRTRGVATQEVQTAMQAIRPHNR